MRNKVSVAVMALMVLGVLIISLPSSQSMEDSYFRFKGRFSGESKLRPRQCCDSCGACTKSIPAKCQCKDMVRSCHPLCKNCVKSALSVDPPLYQCMDLIPNYCKYGCSSTITQ